METRYKNYRIEAYQTEIRRWRARIHRLDGKKLKLQQESSTSSFPRPENQGQCQRAPRSMWLRLSSMTVVSISRA